MFALSRPETEPKTPEVILLTADHLIHQTPTDCPAEKEPDGLAAFSPRHRVWDVKKAAADTVAGVYAQSANPSISKHAKNVFDCSQTLSLLSVCNEVTGEIGYKVSSWKCRERHCPVCQSARARKLHIQFCDALPAIMAEVPDGVFLFLTMTVRNCPVTELRATLAEMGKAWQRLIQRKEFRVVKGWIRGTEVTRSDAGEAHPHFHALLFVPGYYFAGKSYIKHERWIELWQEAAKLDYAPTVDIRRVKVAKGGINEAVKAATYSVKAAELEIDPAWFHELHKQVSGLRFVATGGVIKAALGAKVESEAEDIAEGTDPEGEAARRIVFTWRRPEKRYRYKREK